MLNLMKLEPLAIDLGAGQSDVAALTANYAAQGVEHFGRLLELKFSGYAEAAFAVDRLRRSVDRGRIFGECAHAPL